MIWKYKCRVCECNLDPGEGLICEECRKKIEHKNRPTCVVGITGRIGKNEKWNK